MQESPFRQRLWMDFNGFLIPEFFEEIFERKFLNATMFDLTFGLIQAIIGLETERDAYTIVDHTPVSHGPGVFLYRGDLMDKVFSTTNAQLKN